MVGGGLTGPPCRSPHRGAWKVRGVFDASRAFTEYYRYHIINVKQFFSFTAYEPLMKINIHYRYITMSMHCAFGITKRSNTRLATAQA